MNDYIEAYCLTDQNGKRFTGTPAQLADKLFYSESYVRELVRHAILSGGRCEHWDSVRLIPGMVHEKIYFSPEFPTNDGYSREEAMLLLGREGLNACRTEDRLTSYLLRGGAGLQPIFEVTFCDGSRQHGTLREFQKKAILEDVLRVRHGLYSQAVRSVTPIMEFMGRTRIYSCDELPGWYSLFGLSQITQQTQHMIRRRDDIASRLACVRVNEQGRVFYEIPDRRLCRNHAARGISVHR